MSVCFRLWMMGFGDLMLCRLNTRHYHATKIVLSAILGGKAVSKDASPAPCVRGIDPKIR